MTHAHCYLSPIGLLQRRGDHVLYNSEYCDDDDDDEDNFFRQHEGYKKRKAQKASIKEELMPIAWHPSRRWDWCVPEDEKKRDRKIMGINIYLMYTCI